MDREQAIELLQFYKKGLFDSASNQLNGDIQAFDLAIQALSQEPCEDAISRQAVDTLVDELARAISDERCCMSRGRSTATIMQDILDLPSVKPQESSITWVTGSDGAKIAFWDVPVWKVTKICEILGEPQKGANE